MIGFWRLCCLLAAGAAMLGCGGESGLPGPEKLVPVTGTVLQGGKPLGAATVVFVPRDAKLRGGFGITDEAGAYVAKYRGTETGIEPGEYIVTVSKVAMPDGSPVPAGQSAADVGATQIIPATYADATRSQMIVTVTEGKANEFPIEIPASKK